MFVYTFIPKLAYFNKYSIYIYIITQSGVINFYLNK